MFRSALKLCITIGAASAFGLPASAETLHIGDSAPKLKVDRWMKGKPITSFEKGQVYVVEFWATWCGPCRQAMPHLTELAKKYGGKATFIGVDVWESEHASPGENLKAKADKFVVEVGSRMGYNVCADNDSSFMANNWLHAAGQEGIPCTFVIDKSGDVAWIGHPIELEKPLEEIVSDKFDLKAFASKFNPQIDKEKDSSEEREKIMKPIEDALKAGNFELVVQECDKAFPTSPEMIRYGLAMRKYETLAKHFPARAYAEAKKYEADPAQSWMASEEFAATPGLDKNCYLYAMSFFEKKYKNQPKNFVANAHYAMVYYQLGDYAQAVKSYKLYAAGAKAMKLDPVTLAGIDKEMKKYEEAERTGKPQNTPS